MPYHINSLVVHCRERRQQAVCDAILALPGAEIHAQTADGKLVVTLESDDRNALRRHTETLAALSDVLSAALIYHREEDNLEQDPKNEERY